MNAEIYRFSVGKFACTIVNDGTYTYAEPGKVFFENAPRSGWRLLWPRTASISARGRHTSARIQAW